MSNNTFIAGVFALSVAAGLLSPSSSEAQSASQCGPTDALTETLTEKYGEHEIFVGLSATSTLISVYLNPETGSWTAVRTSPLGRSCIVDSGQAGSVIIPIEGEEM